MVLVRPITIVNTLAKEVSLFLGLQHATNYPHSSLPPVQVLSLYLLMCVY